MNKSHEIGGITLLAALAACGKVGPLEPKAGQAPPAKAYGQTEVPDAEALVTAFRTSAPRTQRRIDAPFRTAHRRSVRLAAGKPNRKPKDENHQSGTGQTLHRPQ